ncbi:hypothetical protein VB780_14405 [Leptolyngbya sp. CCNP1308]|nr:hypothetical protein [Leptolyngbya sp. CCNP1308]MEA5449771.1 hypothetical protein [Leptolyngbya sp. CCNP1308]
MAQRVKGWAPILPGVLPVYGASSAVLRDRVVVACSVERFWGTLSP